LICVASQNSAVLISVEIGFASINYRADVVIVIANQVTRIFRDGVVCFIEDIVLNIVDIYFRIIIDRSRSRSWDCF
tara:strand:+ start:40249 stop:40476 length:228 start_codon:yes stop_codon:yes gene_type:complete